MRSFLVSLLVVCAAMAGCRAPCPCKNTLPPASVLMHPGPGVDGPGPGVMVYQPGVPSPDVTSQIAFVGPEGMTVTWDVGAPGAFDSQPLTCPARYNFPQAAIYRLKLSNVPGRPGVELYPTVEVGPVLPRTEAFLAHNAIPVQFTPEDFDQVQSGNFVTKVIYLPDPEFQELALAGVETLVSTRLDPGVDPIVEADRRGAILAIVRLGNKDLQIPGAPVREGGVAPASYQSPEGCPPVPCASGAAGQTPLGTPVGVPTTMPMGMVAGATAPQYGMPMCGTPIGLPGPPSVPLGVPAGLKEHIIKNHTHVCIPQPSDCIKVDVKQVPGLTYPRPASHVRIVERTAPGVGTYRPPAGSRRECVTPNGACGDGGSCGNECPCEGEGQPVESGAAPPAPCCGK